MTYDTATARRELIDDLLRAGDEIAVAIAYATTAYDLLDETSGDRLEAAVFGPLQKAVGRLRRGVGAFAARHSLPPGAAAPSPPEPHPSQGVAALLEGCVTVAREADDRLSALQDSGLLIELDDGDLRAVVSEVRRFLGDAASGARGFARTLGR